MTNRPWKLLAIDPGSLTTGWALLEIRHGAKPYRCRRLDSGTIKPTPVNLRSWARRFDPLPDRIVCEAVVMTHRRAIRSLAQVVGRIEQALGRAFGNGDRIHTATIHSVLGKERLDIRRAVERRIEGWGPARADDETDAAAVGLVAIWGND